MNVHHVPEVHFDQAMAFPIYPRPSVKHAVLVIMPLTEDGAELPSFIRPQWGSVQVFYGSYYAIVDSDKGVVAYGSAREQWEAMHSPIRPGYWVKTAVPYAYQATGPCRIVTLIPNAQGDVREADYVLDTGDWIVRQPGGEVQHIKLAEYERLYFSAEEAASRGLTAMSADEFAKWAVEVVRTSVI